MRTHTSLRIWWIVGAALLALSCSSSGNGGDTGGQDQTADARAEVAPESTLPDNVTPDQTEDAVPDVQPDNVTPDNVTPDQIEDAVPDVQLDNVTPDQVGDVVPDVEPDGQLPPGSMGPEGGTMEGPEGTKLIVPAGALDKTVVFTMTKVEAPHAGAFSPLSIAIDIGPSGTQFAKDAQVQIPVADLPGSGTVQIYTAAGAGEAWTALATTVEGSTLTANTSHLSWYQAGLESKTDCQQLCDYGVGCMVEYCGLVEPDLSQMIADCPGICETELPPEDLPVLLATEDCQALLKEMAQYNLELLEVCEIQVGPCDDSVPYVVNCVMAGCPNAVPYQTGYEQLIGYNCQQGPDAFGQLALMTCDQLFTYFTQNDKGLAALCTTGPAVPPADCKKILDNFTPCPPPAGTMFAMAPKEMIEFMMCAEGMSGADAISCALASLADCNAFYACFPQD